MARPQTKADLIQQSQENYEKLDSLIASFSPEEQVGAFPFEDRDGNIRDVLIHLYEWHQLLLNWVKANQDTEEVIAFLPAPYNWKNYGEMNVAFWQQHQNTSLPEAQAKLRESHQAVMALIEDFSNDALFTKKYFNWTGTTSLGSYCVSSTSSHYDWGLKKIRKYKRAIK